VAEQIEIESVVLVSEEDSPAAVAALAWWGSPGRTWRAGRGMGGTLTGKRKSRQALNEKQ
jgi:hypothetical protein